MKSDVMNCHHIITARKRSLGQGNIFTPVCHSVHRGACVVWGACMVVGGVHGCGGHTWLQGVSVCGCWGACMVARGACMVVKGHVWLLGGMHGFQGVYLWGGAWLWGGHVWLQGGAWLGVMHRI